MPLTRQYRTNYYYQSDEVVKLGFDTSFSDSLLWKTALLDLISNYNEASGLKMVYDNSNPDIKFMTGNMNYIICGSGEFPLSNDKPGKIVLLNTSYYNYLSDSQKLLLLTHEVGHNLGLRHSDCRNNGEPEVYGWIKIPGTPDNDQNSYMRSGNCGLNWNGFTDGDLITLDYLWPKTYTIDFDNSRPEIKFKIRKGETYYLPYNTFPTISIENKDFQEWHHDKNIYTPLNYETPITYSMHLYPRWIDKREKKKFVLSTHEKAIGTFYMDRVATVTLTCKIRRGLNTWSELSSVDGTYIEITNNNGFKYFLNLKNYMSALLTGDEYLYTTTFYINPNEYDVKLCLTDKLGLQDGANSKHGWIEMSIEY